MIKVPHPSSRDAAELIAEWRSAVTELRRSSRRIRAGTILGPTTAPGSPRADYAPIPRGDSAVRSAQLDGRRLAGSPVAPETSQHRRTRPGGPLHTLIWRAPTG